MFDRVQQRFDGDSILMLGSTLTHSFSSSIQSQRGIFSRRKLRGFAKVWLFPSAVVLFLHLHGFCWSLGVKKRREYPTWRTTSDGSQAVTQRLALSSLHNRAVIESECDDGAGKKEGRKEGRALGERSCQNSVPA